jgi:RNA polymerase sigma factor (sigma-70 family)
MTIDADTLLEHRDFLRRIVRGLLRDETRVDDVLQDTWMTALDRSDLRPEGLRAWLAAVARNLARKTLRSDSRRRRREHAVARPEGRPQEPSVVRQAEEQQRVVAAVLELAEPYRTAILRRYLRDETPAAIAADLGLPAATVRTHVHRGLAKLRQRLDAGGERAAWGVPLAPLLRPRRRPVRASVENAVREALVMTTKRKVAFGVALLLLLMAVVVIGVRSVSSPVAPPDPAPPEREVAAAGETDVREAREPVAPRPTTTSERKPAAPPRPARPGPVVPPGRSGPPPVVVETVGVWGGSYRGPGGMVPPMARAPCDPQPPPPSRIPLPGAGDLSPVEGRRTMSFESWVFWWAHASDEILHRHVAAAHRRSLDTEVRERIAPALARFAEDAKVHPFSRSKALVALARCGAGTTLLRAEASRSPARGPAAKLGWTAILALGLHGGWDVEERALAATLLEAGPAHGDIALLAVGLAGEGDAGLRGGIESRLRKEPSREGTRAGAAIALGLIGDPRSEAALRERLRIRPEIVRTRSPSLPPAPSSPVAVGSPWRSHVATGLGGLGTRGARELLLDLLVSEGRPRPPRREPRPRTGARPSRSPCSSASASSRTRRRAGSSSRRWAGSGAGRGRASARRSARRCSASSATWRTELDPTRPSPSA